MFEQIFEQLFHAVVVSYPIPASILMVIGLLRMINKPLFAFLRMYVKSTADPADDILLDKVEANAVYKAFGFLLDVTASIPIPAKVPADSKAAKKVPPV